MTFGLPGSNSARVTSIDEYNKCLDYFQSQGYNEIDTARVYCGGTQEAFTSQARWQERGLSIATKVYPHQPGLHKPAALRETLEKSLVELKTNCVDIFYLHAPDRSVPFDETLEEVDKLHKEGKFVQLGLSNYTAFEVAEIVITCKERGWVRPTIYQGKYNAISTAFNCSSCSSLISNSGRGIEHELIPACHRYGLEIVIYNPLAGGLFSGKIKSADAPQVGRFAESNSQQGASYRKRYFNDATFQALRIIEEAAQRHNLTMLEIGLRWCVHHSQLNLTGKGRDGIIIGVSSFEQLEGNLEDLRKGPLPEDVVKSLDEAWMATKATEADYWQVRTFSELLKLL